MADFDVRIVNAFAGRRARGNGAGVLVLDDPLPAESMRAIAKRVGLSETAFVVPEASSYGLRWFTPKKEVILCGHATLASAYVLWDTKRLPLDRPARFETLSGTLLATRDGPWIELDFPRWEWAAATPPAGLEAALGLQAKSLHVSGMRYLVEAATEADVRGIRPDPAALMRAAGERSVIVTAPAAEPPFDYVCRYFAPQWGVDEDPATGSIQCVLGPFWQERLGKSDLSVFQCSGPGGVLRVRPGPDRVRIGGRAEYAQVPTLSVPVSG